MEDFSKLPVGDLSNPKQVAPRQVEQQSLLQRSGKVLDSLFGGGTLGGALGGSFAAAGALARGDVEGFQNIAADQPGPLEVIGDVLKIGTTVGSTALPATRAATVLGKLGIGAGVGAGQGAALGVGQELKEGTTRPTELFSRAVKDGTLGGVVGGTFVGLHSVVSAAPRSFMEGALKFSKSVDKLNIEKGADPTKILRDKNIFGTANSIFKQVKTNIGTLEDDISKTIGASAQRAETRSLMQQSIKSTLEEFDGNITDDAVMSIMNRKGLPFKKLLSDGEISVSEANKLRSLIDNKFIGNSKWLSTSPDPMQVVVLKNTAHTLRNFVKSAHPDLPQKFSDLSSYYSAKDVVVNTMATKKGLGGVLAENGILLGGVAGGGAALVSGAASAGTALAFPLVAGSLVAGGRFLGSTMFKSTNSILSQKLGTVLNTLPEQFTKEQLINALIASDQDQETQ